MTDFPFVYLKKLEDKRIKKGHVWVFSNEIDTQQSPLKDFTPGEKITLLSHNKEFLGTGYINPHSLIAIRILSRNPNQPWGKKYLEIKLEQAFNLRKAIFNHDYYRLVHGEGDGIPGLIIDRYQDYLVVQITTAGIEVMQQALVEILIELFHPKAIVLKNDSNVRSLEGLEQSVECIYGEIPEKILVKENNLFFETNVIQGQKTGWFYDQRHNRSRLQDYVKDKKVLDLFSYIGAWGIQAAYYGAKTVTCIDSSAYAIAQIQENAKRNQVNNIKTIQADAFQALSQLAQDKEKFDVIILDPPAFIKRRKDVQNGLQAYKHINKAALKLLSSQGILISCSCSQLLEEEKLIQLIYQQARNLQKNTTILALGQQDIDHPRHPAIPETNYLKAVYMYISD